MIITRGEAVYDGENPVAIALRDFKGMTIYWDRADFRFIDPYRFDKQEHRNLVNRDLRERRDLLAKTGSGELDWVV